MNLDAESLTLDGSMLLAVEISLYQTILRFEPAVVGRLVAVNIQSSGAIDSVSAASSGIEAEPMDAGLDLGRACLDLIGKTVADVEIGKDDLVLTFDDGSRFTVIREDNGGESYQVQVRGEVVLVR